MSCSRGCDLVELKPNEWYCIVANDEYDYDFASFTVYGPRATSDAALDRMSSSESNPGGFCTFPHARVTEAHKTMIARGSRR